MTKKKADTASDAGRDLLARHDGQRFHTILADPPWQFQNRTGKMAPEHKRLSRYGTMSLDDIMAMETGSKFADAVRRGNNYVDAYRLANFDALQRGQRAAGEQAARNAAAGLQHQQRTRQTTGDTPAPVPAGVKAFYKALNPNATDAEISAHYNKTHKAG